MSFSWVFLGDAWGFSEMMTLREKAALHSLERTAELLPRLRKNHSAVRYFMFSDSILCARQIQEAELLSVQESEHAFSDILVAVLFLISEFMNAGLLLRGVVVFGELHWEGDLVFGKALRAAAKFEKTVLAPPLVFLPVSELYKAAQARCLSGETLRENVGCSLPVTTKSGGLLQVLALLGDEREALRKRLKDSLAELTLCAEPAPLPAAAIQSALDLVDRVLSAGRQS